jgi:hypothetical protein
MDYACSDGTRPPGEMPPIDPSSETDETINAIVTRTETGKLTVARRETHRPPETPEAPSAENADGADLRPGSR